jgi:imidazolonepropionase-like amidohydrolase
LRNATLFDGEAWRDGLVDIVLDRGIVSDVVKSSGKPDQAWEGAVVYQLHGRYVTPGLVDMHSHHFTGVWPATEINDDTNEMTGETKAFTPMVRAIDALKPYDIAAKLIAAGGVTSSLLIPGSANLIGGEGVTVKNALYSGEHGEPVVQDLLLERGVPVEQRRRYMKMAYGENPKLIWGYTRLGNAWHLREHLQRAKDLKEQQDDYCAVLAETNAGGDTYKSAFVRQNGKFPFSLELESTIGVLRGSVYVHNHNYEPEDLETMLRISDEFGYRIWGLHHAIEAWQVPEMLKEQGQNVTIATFAEFSLYKWEAYNPSLFAGHILDKHGIPVAYKSDHSAEFVNARYLMQQASVGYSYKLPEDKALQAVSSIPAKALDLDFRVGYCRPSYDADVVVWDNHPLAVAATPLQVFIDGIPQLDNDKVREATGSVFHEEATAAQRDLRPQVRTEPDEDRKEEFCSEATQPGQSFIITGIRKALVKSNPQLQVMVDSVDTQSALQLVVSNGNVVCLGTEQTCASQVTALKTTATVSEIHLENGHLAPGLTALTRGLGMREIATLDSTGDGEASGQRISDPQSINYAKYGVWLEGKSFARARLGGITRAVSPPLADSAGLVTGVSVEILTCGRKSLMDGAIVQDDVALHLNLGDLTKISEGTVSDGIKHIRKMLEDGKGKTNETIFGKVSAGELPLVVQCDNKVRLVRRKKVMIAQRK